VIVKVGDKCAAHPEALAVGVAVREGRDVPACRGCYRELIAAADLERAVLRDESGGDS
jgi:hypothetical protein